jgi:hypothetical protein
MNFVVNLFVAVLLENFFQFQMQDSFVLSEVSLPTSTICCPGVKAVLYNLSFG